MSAMNDREHNLATAEPARQAASEPSRPAAGLTVPFLPPLGALTLGAMAVCVASGVVLFTGFEPANPLASTLAFETGRPFGWFVRSLHAWSAQLSLLALLAHTADHVVRKSDRNSPAATWGALVASLPTTLYLMLGGRAMPGDAEANGVASVMYGILAHVPGVGPAAASWLVGGQGGGDVHVLTAHHVATATLTLALIIVFHIRKLAPDSISAATALGLSGIVALFARPVLVYLPVGGKLHGPWYMGGLRLMLGYVPVWAAGLMFPAVVLAVLTVLPLATPKRAAVMRWTLAVVFVVTLLLTIAAVRA